MANPLGSFIWYELMTTDPDGAAQFYNAITGWHIPEHASAGAPLDYRHILRDDGKSNGGMLGLTPEMCDQGAHPCWVGYLYVADVDAAIAAISADGGRVLMPTTTIDVGSFAMVTDPQGVPFYVMTPIAPAGHDGEPSDVYDRWEPGHVSWNELYTADLASAKAFYARHFGFAFNEALHMGPELGDYCFIDHGGQTIGAMMQKPPQVPVPGWNFYIRVGDIDAAKTTAEAKGGRVVHGPVQVPGGDWIINGFDPQGASFALVGKRMA